MDGFAPDATGTMRDTVEVQYEFWTAPGNGNGNGNGNSYKKTDSARVQATYLHMSGTEAVFELVHPSVSGEQYLAGETMTLTVVATRADTTLSKSDTLDVVLSTTGTENCV